MNSNFRKAVAVLILFLVLAAAHLYMYAQNMALTYRITDLKIKRAELSSLARTLGSQAAREEDLAYIEKTAKTKLGMIYPDDITYIVTSGPGPADRATAGGSRELN
ncbi:MAG: septum formation initiator family protein [Candidatus Saganbacteria bacterium]|nr:septum formation initiator family protein [Candidatus Saganbacteria bacterium]